SLKPSSLLGIVFPGIHRHANPFVGLAALVLGLAALAGSWRDPMVKLFSAISLAGLVLALGNNSIFHGLLYSVFPMVEKARNPSMAVFIFNLGAAVLAAHGLDAY